MITCCIWVSMAWRIARRSSAFSLAWENALLIVLKTPRDECVCYDSFITRKLFSILFVPSSTLSDRYATEMNRLLELRRADDEDQVCFTVVSLSQFEIFEHGIHAHISDTTHVGRTGPEGSAPKLFLSGKHCH